MSKVTKRPWLISIILASALTSCGDFDEPEALSPQRFFGCYGDQINELTIARDKVLINGAELPYEIQERRIGYVLVIPAVFHGNNDTLQVKDAADHLYRLIDEPAGRYIKIVDQEAYIYKLNFGACA